MISKIKLIIEGKNGMSALVQTILAKSFMMMTQIVSGIILSRLLGPDGRGEQAAMIVWPGLLAYSLTLGLPTSLIYNLKSNREQESELYTAAIAISLLLSFVGISVGFLGIPYWLNNYSDSTIHQAQWLIFSTPMIFISLLIPIPFQIKGDFKILNQSSALPQLLIVAGLFLLFIAKAVTPESVAIVYIVSPCIVSICYLIYSFRKIKFVIKDFFKSSKSLLFYGIQSYGFEVLSTISSQLDQVICISMLTPSEMGIYVVSLSIARLLNVIQSSVLVVLLTKISARELDEIIAITGLTVRITLVLSGFLGGITIIFAPFLVHLMYGKEFDRAAVVLRILIPEVILNGLSMNLSQVFIAFGKPFITTLQQSISVISILVLLPLLVKANGLEGAALAILVATSLQLVGVLLSYPFFLKRCPPRLIPTKHDFQTFVSLGSK